MGPAEAEPTRIECAEKDRLLREYQATTAAFSRVVQMLAERSGTMRKAEFEEILEHAEVAQRKFESVREDLDRHTDEHGCLGG